MYIDVALFMFYAMNFMANWKVLRPFGIFCGQLPSIFFPFWYVMPRKIWQPCVQPISVNGLVRK
jgi:hypothetical protein